MEGLPAQTTARDWICQNPLLNFRESTTSTVKGGKNRKQVSRWCNQKQRPSCYLGDLPSLLSQPNTPWNTTAWLAPGLSFRFFTLSWVTSSPHDGWNIKQNFTSSSRMYSVKICKVQSMAAHTLHPDTFLLIFSQYSYLYPSANENILKQAKHTTQIIQCWHTYMTFHDIV